MKTALLTCLPALLAAAFLGGVYGLRSMKERRLRQSIASVSPQFPAQSPSTATTVPSKKSGLPAPASETPPVPDKPLPPADREIVPLTSAQGLQLMRDILARSLPPGTVIQEWELPQTAKKLFPALDPLSPEQLAALISVKPKPDPGRPGVMSETARRGALEPLLIREAALRLARQPAAVILRAFEGLDPLSLNNQSPLILGAVSALAKTDPDAAWAWVSRQPKNIWDVPARNAVLTAAAGGDALRWLELTDHYAANFQVLLTGRPAALESPRFREAWIGKIMETRGKDAAQDLREFAVELHSAQGFEAARDFVNSHPSLPERDALIRTVGTGNLSGGGSAKADWLVSSSSPGSLAASTTQLIQSWTARDPAAAADWLNATPPSAAWHDPGLLAFSTAIAPHDLKAARAFAAKITDPALREKTLNTLSPPLDAALPQ